MPRQTPVTKEVTLGNRCPLLILIAVLASSCGSDGKAPPGGAAGAIGTGGAAFASGGAIGMAGASGSGAGGGASGAPAGTGGAGLCRRSGEPCSTPLDCCDDATCNSTSAVPELNGCHPRCMQNTDCATGCCIPFSGQTRGFCGDAKWCSCGAAGARCGSTMPMCCADQTCLAGDAQQSFYECKKRCMANADCPTNCCVPVPSLNLSACLGASYCSAP